MHVRILAVLLFAALLLPPLAPRVQAQSLGEIRDELAEVRTERDRIEERIAESTRRMESLEERIAGLAAEQQALTEQVEALRRDLDELAALVATRVRASYKHGSTMDPIAVFLGSDDPDAALSRAQTIFRVVAGDQAKNQDLKAARARLAAAEELLDQQSEELDLVRAEQSEVVDRLRADFAEIQELEAQLTREEREEQERLRREKQRREREQQAAERAAQPPSSSPSPSSAQAPTGSGGMVCPLDQPRHFIDSWGYARSGGRSHRGTDIMGPRGIPVRAIVDGTWQIQSRGASAGLWAILRGSDGHHYWYLHLDSHTVANGARVSAGQQVATNGATGNATAGAEHIHFELHPGGGSAVNPYPLLRRVCG